MFSFFKKKLSKYPFESKWSVLEGEHNGHPIFIRRNDSVHGLITDSEYSFRTGVAVPFQKRDESGLPLTDEAEMLNEIEDALNEQLEKNRTSILVLSITTNGMREFVYYTLIPDTIESAIEVVRSKFPGRVIQSYIKEDKSWSLYRDFIK